MCATATTVVPPPVPLSLSLSGFPFRNRHRNIRFELDTLTRHTHWIRIWDGKCADPSRCTPPIIIFLSPEIRRGSPAQRRFWRCISGESFGGAYRTVVSLVEVARAFLGSSFGGFPLTLFFVLPRASTIALPARFGLAPRVVRYHPECAKSWQAAAEGGHGSIELTAKRSNRNLMRRGGAGPNSILATLYTAQPTLRKLISLSLSLSRTLFKSNLFLKQGYMGDHEGDP